MRMFAAEMEPEAILFCDGGARGNPGPAAAGFVLRKWSAGGASELLQSDGIYLGIATNNEAEYKALILGLQAAIALGLKRLAIRLDSELLVRQLLRRYRVKNERLKPLFGEAVALLGKLDWWEAVHVPRDHNKEADELVNAALDAALNS